MLHQLLRVPGEQNFLLDAAARKAGKHLDRQHAHVFLALVPLQIEHTRDNDDIRVLQHVSPHPRTHLLSNTCICI